MQSQKTTKKSSVNSAAAVLWASAFLLAGLVILQAGKLPANQAVAEMGLEAGDYTLLTLNSGRGDDVDPQELLCVIDNRGGTLLLYEIEDARKRQILLRGGGDLENLFRNARQ